MRAAAVDTRLFGEDAKEQAHLNPTNTVYDMKRLIGRRYADNKIKYAIDKHWPFKVLDINGQPQRKIVFFIINFFKYIFRVKTFKRTISIDLILENIKTILLKLK